MSVPQIKAQDTARLRVSSAPLPPYLAWEILADGAGLDGVPALPRDSHH